MQINDTKPLRSPVYSDVRDSPSTGTLGSLTSKANRPELKRYRQYTRHDIAAAIEAVRGGMSALQASRLYGVPSRTLYDKVKKLGIVTGRPYRQSIAVAVSLAQQNSGSIRDDDDSMDSPDPRHHFHPLGRGNPLEELGLYFGSKAAALGLPGLPGLQGLQALQGLPGLPGLSASADDARSAALPAPIDLSQSYERMLRGESESQHGVTDSVDKSELIAEKSG